MRLLIIDDHVLFREGLISLLSSQPDFLIVGETGSGEEAIDKIPNLHPDLVLLDIGLKDGSGPDTISNIATCFPQVNVVVLTLLESDEAMISAIRRGARGYLLKTTPLSKLVTTLRAVERGEAALSRRMTWRVLEELSRQNGKSEISSNHLNGLTDREIEVLRYLGAGASNREISERLFIAHNTVKNHVHNILYKLNLRNRREAARFARYRGIINSVHGIENIR
jgi:two-component system NarL family response regulator